MLDDADIRDLVERYDTRAPRYTSYPPAPHWRDSAGPRFYREALGDLAGAAPVAVYVHIPFCARLCLYCGCNVRITRRRDLIDRYLAALDREISVVAEVTSPTPASAQLHLGGGTPTFLDPDRLGHVIDAIDRRLAPTAAAERSIEVDPRVTTREHLAMLRARGFTRLSLGVQDVDPDVQRAIGREYPAQRLCEFVADCRELGVGGINLDLIYGLPRQTADSWDRTLDVIAGLRPDRLAVYGYAHVPWLKPHQRALERHGIPGAPDRLSMLLQVRRRLIELGYVAIGMDHFALPTDELAAAFLAGTVHRNFMGYTVQASATTVAFGASAIGDLPGAYVHNDPSVEGYCRRIERDGIAPWREHPLTPDDRIRRRLIIRLLGNFAIRPAELEREFEIDFARWFEPEIERLEELTAAGLLVRHDDGWIATEAGALVVRNIAMVFDRYREPEARQAQRYSASI